MVEYHYMLNFERLGSLSRRTSWIPFFTNSFALLYHICAFFAFYFFKVYPLFFFNIASILIFSILLYIIPKIKKYVLPYMVAVLEVITHQLIASYLLGTVCEFHYLILIIGFLPFLIFGQKLIPAILVALPSMILFVLLEIFQLDGKYVISAHSISVFRIINISVSIFTIFVMLLIFAAIVLSGEKQMTEKNQHLESEIEMAATIQQNFFKQDISNIKNLEVGCYNRPMAGVSGDIFDFYKTGDNLDGFGIFDVSGHGISSGLITMLVKNIIQQEFYNMRDYELWEILNKINDRIIDEKGNIENYLTGILVRPKGNDKLEIVCAGHPVPIIYRKKTNKCEFLSQGIASMGAIGIAGFPVFYKSIDIDFEEGDEIIFYTDGIIEVTNAENEQFGKIRLLDSVMDIVDENVSDQVTYIAKSVQRFCGSVSPKDDITFVILRHPKEIDLPQI